MTMYKYFPSDLKTLDDLKKAYRRLAMQYHPDRGGSTEAMQEINNEHDAIFQILKARHNETHDEQHQTTETAEEFREILSKLIVIPGLEIELCGAWLWIGGETMKNKEALKAAGCRWSHNKKLWYWRHAEDAHPWHRGTATMGEIRRKYGSESIRSGRSWEQDRIEAAS